MKLKPLGMALGLAGNLALGWGIYTVMGIGSCGGAYPPCPGGAALSIAAIPVGIIVSVIAIFLGGALSFIGVFAAVGIASILRGLIGGVGGDGDTIFPFVFGGFFLLPTLLPILFIPFAKRARRRGERLKAIGRHGIGTVTGVQDTGVAVNNNPRVRLTLDIEPADGGASFVHEEARIVPRVDIPRAGDRYRVLFDPDDPSHLAIGQELRAETPPAPERPPAQQDWVNELGSLNDLRLQGALTDEEFTKAKDRLLSAGSPREPAAG